MSAINQVTSTLIYQSHYHQNLSYLEYIDQNLSKNSEPIFNRIKFKNTDDNCITYDKEIIDSNDVYQLRLVGRQVSSYEYPRCCFGYYTNNSINETFNSTLEINFVSGNLSTLGTIYYGDLVEQSSKVFKSNI